MVKLYPKFYLSLGEVGDSSVYIKDSNGDWNKFDNYEYFKVVRSQNQVSEFEIKMSDIEDDEKIYVKEFAEIAFYSETNLILKGRIQKITYSTAYECVATGYGAEAKLLEKELIKSNDKRVQYSVTSAQTIANEILSESTDGVSPWIMQPSTDGVFSTDWGDVSIRYEYANRLNALAKLAESINYEWWVTQQDGDPSSDFFNLAEYQPTTTRATVSQETFAITGTSANCSLTNREKDITNLANKIDGLGYGDGINQLHTSAYNASETYSTLSSDITSSSTTITLADATDFDSTGTIRIMEELVTYTGKSGNNLTGCSRGASSTTAYEHKKGIFVEKYVAITSAESGSSIGTNGLLDTTITNKDIIDRATLELVVSRELLDKMNPIERIIIIPNEPLEIAGSRKVGDLVTITDEESSLSGDYRIVSITYQSDYGDLSMEIECSNRSLTFIEQMQKQKENTENMSKYMQGATNLLALTETSEGDDTTSGYINLRFYLPEDVKVINKALLNFQMNPVKGFQTIADVQQATFSLANVPGIPTELGYVTVNVITGQKVLVLYSAIVDIDAANTGILTYLYKDGVWLGAGYSGDFSLAGNDVGSSVISRQFLESPSPGSIRYSVYGESFGATTPDITGGTITAIIFSSDFSEGTLTSPSVDIYVGEDGGTMTLKGTYTENQISLDITDLVQAVGTEKWIDIQFRPNQAMRIEANAFIKVFIEST